MFNGRQSRHYCDIGNSIWVVAVIFICNLRLFPPNHNPQNIKSDRKVLIITLHEGCIMRGDVRRCRVSIVFVLLLPLS